ncbi:MAG: putative toxin-antitoxin system toxin component, PIN family [Gammaproteobacteria bacterium]|nr:putative toxin-antitoxin system toxin component, PIN family [Gammaproteobacteria bacterium]
MPRLVLGTNCVVSAFLWGGIPRQLINAAVDNQCQIYTSGALLAELEDVLSRDKFRHRFISIQTSVSQLLIEFSAWVIVVHANNLPVSICPDPDDDAVLACAIAAKAQLIVSGDHDLLELKHYQGIPIVTPAEALKQITAGA